MKRVVKFVQRWNFTRYLEFDIDLEKKDLKESCTMNSSILSVWILND